MTSVIGTQIQFLLSQTDGAWRKCLLLVEKYDISSKSSLYKNQNTVTAFKKITFYPEFRVTFANLANLFS